VGPLNLPADSDAACRIGDLTASPWPESHPGDIEL